MVSYWSVYYSHCNKTQLGRSELTSLMSEPVLQGAVFLTQYCIYRGQRVKKFYWFLKCSMSHISFSSLVTCHSFCENRSHIVPLESEQVMSTPTYDPVGTETTYKSKLFLCQMGHKQKWTLPVLALRGGYINIETKIYSCIFGKIQNKIPIHVDIWKTRGRKGKDSEKKKLWFLWLIGNQYLMRCL